VCAEVVIVGDFPILLCFSVSWCWRSDVCCLRWCCGFNLLLKGLRVSCWLMCVALIVSTQCGFEVDSCCCFYGYDFFLLDKCWALLVKWGVIVFVCWRCVYILSRTLAWYNFRRLGCGVPSNCWILLGFCRIWEGCPNLWQFRHLRVSVYEDVHWHVHILSLLLLVRLLLRKLKLSDQVP